MKKILVVPLISIVIAILGAFLTEYVLKIGVLGSSNFKYFIGAGIIAAITAYLIGKKPSYAGATLVGFLLIPYMVFILGQIDFYMVDDNLAQGVSVIEVRPTMDKIAFGTADKGEVAVWSGPQTLTLHPGENRVKLGRFNMAKGTYQGGTVYIGDIQVDIQMDLSVIKGPDGQNPPPEQYEQTFEMIKSQMESAVKILKSSLSGNIASLTIGVGPMTQAVPLPQISYPGMGGPDITLDITLGPDGRPDPSKIKVIIDMPPGVGGAFPSMPGVEFR